MIDIIFFLLVFFMLTSLQMIEQHSLPIDLPKSSQAKADVLEAIEITVLADGKIRLGDSDATLDELRAHIAAKAKENEAARVVLRGDSSAGYGAVVTVLDEIKKAGAKHISLAAEYAK
jgi:biopolymer transport protein ExbD